MLQSLLNTLFGCSHQRTTFPLTPARNSVANPINSGIARNGTYVTCLDCGKEFAYDWKAMRIGQPMAPVHAVTTQPSFR